MLNLIIHNWKSAGVTSRGRALGSAVAEIFINLFVSGGLGAGGGGGGTCGGPPPVASAREHSAALAFLVYPSSEEEISAIAASRSSSSLRPAPSVLTVAARLAHAFSRLDSSLDTSSILTLA